MELALHKRAGREDCRLADALPIPSKNSEVVYLPEKDTRRQTLDHIFLHPAIL
jgi:hypothetical protein